jgi:hypothetical protein
MPATTSTASGASASTVSLSRANTATFDVPTRAYRYDATPPDASEARFHSNMPDIIERNPKRLSEFQVEYDMDASDMDNLTIMNRTLSYFICFVSFRFVFVCFFLSISILSHL